MLPIAKFINNNAETLILVVFFSHTSLFSSSGVGLSFVRTDIGSPGPKLKVGVHGHGCICTKPTIRTLSLM